MTTNMGRGCRLSIVNWLQSFSRIPAQLARQSTSVKQRPPIEIVGVAADAKYAAMDEEVATYFFLPYLQQDDARMYLRNQNRRQHRKHG